MRKVCTACGTLHVVSDARSYASVTCGLCGSQLKYVYRAAPWEQTPRWHPYNWLGLTLRRWIDDLPWDVGWWEYGRPKRVAREALKEKFDVA